VAGRSRLEAMLGWGGGSVRSEVAALRGRCDRLDALVRRGVEQGWLTQREREAALWFPEAGG
jgi:hypothetical protein